VSAGAAREEAELRARLREVERHLAEAPPHTGPAKETLQAERARLERRLAAVRRRSV